MKRISFILYMLGISIAHAEAPFLIDDPNPTDADHAQIYFFSSVNNTDLQIEAPFLYAPAVEIDWGAWNNVELHAIIPYAWEDANFNSPNGIGDIEIGFKYRFVEETNYLPNIAFAPRFEIPTGNVDRGLGNGRSWILLPFWAEKGFGQWMLDAGGGLALNSAPGLRNYFYGGVVVEYLFNNQFSLGLEALEEGAISDEGRASTVLNMGGAYHFNDHVSAMLSGGHSIFGQQRTVAYMGIFWLVP